MLDDEDDDHYCWKKNPTEIKICFFYWSNDSQIDGNRAGFSLNLRKKVRFVRIWKICSDRINLSVNQWKQDIHFHIFYSWIYPQVGAESNRKWTKETFANPSWRMGVDFLIVLNREQNTPLFLKEKVWYDNSIFYCIRSLFRTQLFLAIRRFFFVLLNHTVCTSIFILCDEFSLASIDFV